MRKIRPLMTVLLGLAIVAGAALSGCTSTETDADTRAMLEEIDKAHRLYDSALALMTNPVYTVRPTNGAAELPPTVSLPDLEKYSEQQIAEAINQAEKDPGTALPERIETAIKQFDFETAPDLHPEALETIARAETLLEEALEEYPGANSSAKGAAMGLQGQLALLEGRYHNLAASIRQNRLSQQMQEVRGKLMILRDKDRQAGYYDGLASGVKPAAAAEEARAAAKEAQSSIESLEKKREKLTADLKKRNAKIQALTREAVEIKKEVAGKSAREGLPRLREAFRLEIERDKLRKEVLDIEQQIEQIDREIPRLRLLSKSWGDRAAARTEEAGAREAQKSRYLERKKAFLAAAAEARKDLEQAIAVAADEANAAAENESKARSAYDAAAGRSDVAYRQNRAPEYRAQQGDAALAAGEIAIDRLRINNLGTALAGEIANAYQRLRELGGSAQLPDEISAFGNYVEKPDVLKEAAVASFDDAISSYSDAIREVEQLRRWVYDAQLAAAHAGKFLVTGNDSDLTLAQQHLADALEGRDRSPYLRDAVALGKIIERIRSVAKTPTNRP